MPEANDGLIFSLVLPVGPQPKRSITYEAQRDRSLQQARCSSGWASPFRRAALRIGSEREESRHKDHTEDCRYCSNHLAVLEGGISAAGSAAHTFATRAES